MTKEDLKPGMVVAFEYNLVIYPDMWIPQRECIVLKSPYGVRVFCLYEERVFFMQGKLRKIREIPWRLL